MATQTPLLGLYKPETADAIEATIGHLAANMANIDTNLAGVRIVEMGENANGTYVRWENGLQVCYIGPVDTVFTNPSNLAYSWAYPAAFASTPRVYATGYYQAFSTKFRGTAHLVYSRQAGTNKADIGFGSSAAWEDGDQSLGEQIMGYAIGRWK